jgi:hypothetical protein
MPYRKNQQQRISCLLQLQEAPKASRDIVS